MLWATHWSIHRCHFNAIVPFLPDFCHLETKMHQWSFFFCQHLTALFLLLLQKPTPWTGKPAKGSPPATSSACMRSTCSYPAVRASMPQWRPSCSTTCWSACPWTRTTSRTCWRTWWATPLAPAATRCAVAWRPPEDTARPAAPRPPSSPARTSVPTWTRPTASRTRAPARRLPTAGKLWARPPLPTRGPCGGPGRPSAAARSEPCCRLDSWDFHFFSLKGSVTFTSCCEGKFNLAHVINQHPAVFLHPCADQIPQFCKDSTHEKRICRTCPLNSTKMEYLMLYDWQESGFISGEKEQGMFFLSSSAVTRTWLGGNINCCWEKSTLAT